MTRGRQIAHHHAEAVIEGHRDGYPVGVGIGEEFPHQVAVVADVAVREGRTLRETRCARGVLDVDRVVWFECRRAFCDSRQLVVRRLRDQLLPCRRLEADHLTQLRRRRTCSVEHALVVGVLVPLCCEDDAGSRLRQRIVEFVLPVRRVEVDENGTDLRRGVLGDHPLGAIGRPESDAVTLAHSESEQTRGERQNVGAELAVGPGAVGGRVDEREIVGKGLGRACQCRTDRLGQQRWAVFTTGIRQFDGLLVHFGHFLVADSGMCSQAVV